MEATNLKSTIRYESADSYPNGATFIDENHNCFVAVAIDSSDRGRFVTIDQTGYIVVHDCGTEFTHLRRCDFILRQKMGPDDE